jgi:hypothetical protein
MRNYKKGTCLSAFGTASYNAIDNGYNFTDGTVNQQQQRNYNLTLDPTYGVFLTDHFILAGVLTLDYNHDKTDDENLEPAAAISTSKVLSTQFGIGPLVRYCFFNGTPGNNLFYLQVLGTLGKGSGSSSGYGENATSNYVSNGKLSGIFTYRGGAAVGVTHFVTKTLGLDVSVGYNYVHQSYTDAYNTATTNTVTGITRDPLYSDHVNFINNGITVSAGFHYFFR